VSHVKRSVPAERAWRIRPVDGDRLTSRALRTPRAAAIAGVLFALLLTAALALVRVATSADPGDTSTLLGDPTRKRMVALALNLVPFAGIAFLWFIGVVRDRIGEHEDRFFATVFLGSGLLFVAMLFVASAVTAGFLARLAAQAGASRDLSAFGRSVGAVVLHTYAMRMAAVFTISTATIGLRTGFIPRWLAFSGYAIAVVLLVAIDFTRWVELLFPLWILLFSLDTLVRNLGEAGAGTCAPGTAAHPRR
jgi:hypothetical protein